MQSVEHRPYGDKLMRIRWKGFELPTNVILEEETKSESYGKFIIEPFERGFGITIGNSLRRVLLSSLEGTAPVSLKIEGAMHEFASISGIYEDVINIALNVKGILINYDGHGAELIHIEKTGKGPVTCADITSDCPGLKIANPEHVICNIVDEKTTFKAEIEFRKGRGYIRCEDFPWEINTDKGVVPLDASFSPIRRSRWRVEETRVGKMTNYDKLILEIWTDGTISPEDSLVEAGIILRKHINPIVKFNDIGEEFQHDAPGAVVAQDNNAAPIDNELREKLDQPVSVLDPSVRAANCLAAEGIKTVLDLCSRQESDMLQVRNFGKTSLKEIKMKLAERALSFGMDL